MASLPPSRFRSASLSNRGERLAQIDSAGRNKLRAQVDEYYLNRVSEGLTANAEVNGRTWRMRVAKIYPQVRNGSFEIDLQFVGEEPRDLQRGQTVQLRMTLGASTQARLVPNGAFYNETGGAYVFVVAPDGGSADQAVRSSSAAATPTISRFSRGWSPASASSPLPTPVSPDKDRLDLDE